MAEDASTTTPTEGGDKTFTQAELDTIISDRLKRQAAQLKKDTPDADELEALRADAEKYKAIEDASKDDLDKANEQIADLQGQLAKKDAEIDTLTTTSRTLAVKQAVTAEAAKAQFGEEKTDTFVDPEDAFLRLDQSKVEYDDEGNPSNIADLVGEVAGNHSHLLGARRSQGPDMDIGVRETVTDNPDLTPEQEHAQWLAERI